MNFNNYTCDGQMNIFDFLEAPAPAPATSHTIDPNADMIAPQLLNYIDGQGFYYIREVDGRQMNAYWLIADNGLCYCKDFYSFNFILKFSNVESAKKGVKKYFDEAFRKNPLPENTVAVNPKSIVEYEAMYRCKKGTNWDYTSQRCSWCAISNCAFSGHICNKANLWDIATNDLGIDCPKTCCRQCKHNTECGCACNGVR